jgi:putative peptidoglycan lipid II flippase
VQIAMFADTIIATLLPTGAVSALYYADRIYQLPLGVIGIAAGTVLLPEMSRLVASGRPEEARQAQNRAMLLTWLMAAPFLAAFLIVPDLFMHALFARGAFTAASADAAGAALLAYGAGLPAVVLIRSAVASFYAQGDTATPLWASLTAVAVNVAFKIVLMGPLEQAGLALATSIGAWTNLGLLVLLATRRGAMRLDRRFLATALAIGAATVAMGLVMVGVDALAGPHFAAHSGIQDLLRLAMVGAAGGLAYVAVSGLLLRPIIGSLSARRRATTTRASGLPDRAGNPDIPPAVPPD